MIATIIIAVLIALVVAFVIVKLVKNKKSGKGTCNCGCGGCSMKDCCSGDKLSTNTGKN